MSTLLSDYEITQETFDQGTEVYDRYGNICYYEAPARTASRAIAGHLVRPLEMRGDEEYPGDIEMHRQVFEEPPVRKRATELEQIEADIERARQRLSEQHREYHRLQRELPERMKVLAARDRALTRIEAVLDGRITHWVVDKHGNLEIIGHDEAIKSDESGWQEKTKLVTLWGQSGGDLEWRIHRYSDGSGSSHQMAWPCISEADAIEVLARVHGECVADVTTPEAEPWKVQRAITNADRYDLPVPPSWRVLMASRRAADDLESQAKKERELHAVKKAVKASKKALARAKALERAHDELAAEAAKTSVAVTPSDIDFDDIQF